MDNEMKDLLKMLGIKTIGGLALGTFIGKAGAAALKECNKASEVLLTYVGCIGMAAGAGYYLIDKPVNAYFDKKHEMELEDSKEKEEPTEE